MNRSTPAPAAELRFLNLIAIVAVIDVILLIPLVWASRWVADKHDIVSVLGPTHGFLFVILVGLCAWGAIQRWWGWWFPIVTVITFGPPGSLIGDFVIRRQLRERSAGESAPREGSGP